MKYDTNFRLYSIGQSQAYPSAYPPAYPAPYPSPDPQSRMHFFADAEQINRVNLNRVAIDQMLAPEFQRNHEGSSSPELPKEGRVHYAPRALLVFASRDKEPSKQLRSSTIGRIETILRAVIGKDQLDPAIGDLQERAMRIQERSGTRAATRWYRSQLLLSIPSFLLAALMRLSGLESIYKRTGR